MAIVTDNHGYNQLLKRVVRYYLRREKKVKRDLNTKGQGNDS